MFVWIRVADYGRVAVVAETRHGGNWASSGSLTAGTITTGTTLFNTADDPTSEMHIGKLYAHDDVILPDKNSKTWYRIRLYNIHNGSNHSLITILVIYILKTLQMMKILFFNVMMVQVVSLLISTRW